MEPVPKPEFAIVTRASSKPWIPEVIAYAGAEVTETYMDEYTVEVLYAACFLLIPALLKAMWSAPK